MGTNIGLKPASIGDDEQTDEDLYYVESASLHFA
jgi:hypothetical protein